MPIPPDLAERLADAGRKAQAAPAERNRLIREAHTRGGGVREIARVAGLSHQAVRKILQHTAA